jgi:hypothetical protein
MESFQPIKRTQDKKKVRFNYSTLMMEAAGSSETSVHLQQTQRQIPEDRSHH